MNCLSRITACARVGNRFLSAVSRLGRTVRRNRNMAFRCHSCKPSNALVPRGDHANTNQVACATSPCRVICGGKHCCLVYRLRNRSGLHVFIIGQVTGIDTGNEGNAIPLRGPTPTSFSTIGFVHRHPCPMTSTPVHVHVTMQSRSVLGGIFR